MPSMQAVWTITSAVCQLGKCQSEMSFTLQYEGVTFEQLMEKLNALVFSWSEREGKGWVSWAVQHVIVTEVAGSISSIMAEALS